MADKRQAPAEDTLSIELTAAEHGLVLEGLTCLTPEVAQILRATPAGQTICMTDEAIDEFAGAIAIEFQQCSDASKAETLKAIFGKLLGAFDVYLDEMPSEEDEDEYEDEDEKEYEAEDEDDFDDAMDESAEANQILLAMQMGIQVLVTSGQLDADRQGIELAELVPVERASLAAVPGIAKPLQEKLARQDAHYSIAEIASMINALVDDSLPGAPLRRAADMHLLRCLILRLQDSLPNQFAMPNEPFEREANPPTDAVYQFKITLEDIAPPIWRRIQVQDCTLDELHEHIQAAMGWSNSHLHEFKIKGESYGDPDLLGDDTFDAGCNDSTATLLSEVLPAKGKRFVFKYQYDFGDSWNHKIQFEGKVKPDLKAKYPQCLEGERACPPEDCGGIFGYADLLEAIADPKHPEHRETVAWVGKRFDPEKFDAAKATKAMR